MKRNLWSPWSEYLNVSSTDPLEEFSEKIVPQTKTDVMKLPLKDMNLFGYCSEYDDFFLVICQFCGKNIKPQSLKSHIELRHQKINMRKSSPPRSVQQLPLLTYLKPNCSTESSTNEDRLSKTNDSSVCSLSETKDKLKFRSNKKNTVYVHPYPRPNSVNSCQKKNDKKLASYSPSSDVGRASLSRSITAENLESRNNPCARKMSFPESSSSTCDSQTSMTVFLHHSFVMPNMKLCDIKDRPICLSSKTLPEKNCLSKATIFTQVLPEKRSRQNIRSPRQGSQVHNQSEEVADWSSMSNSTNVGLNGMTYAAWNQHSSHFRPLPHSLPMSKSGQINSHSFNCSDLTKKFGDLESQVLIHNAAMGT